VNTVLTRVPKTKEVAGDFARLFYHDGLHNLYSSPDISIKSRRIRGIRYTGLVACMIKMRNAYNILVGKPGGKRLFGSLYLGVDGRMILKWILNK
jgi:hypothetical protein